MTYTSQFAHLAALVAPDALAGLPDLDELGLTLLDVRPYLPELIARRVAELRAKSDAPRPASFEGLPKPTSSRQPKARARAPYVPARVPTELEQKDMERKLRRLGLVKFKEPSR